MDKAGLVGVFKNKGLTVYGKWQQYLNSDMIGETVTKARDDSEGNYVKI